jgi:hypothetical protein
MRWWWAPLWTRPTCYNVAHWNNSPDREFEHRSGKTKDYKIGICCFSAKHTALRRKSKDWFARNQNNVSRVKLHVYPRTVVSVSYIVACWSSSKRSSSSSHWKLKSFVLPDLCSNSRSTTLEVSMLTIMPLMRFLHKLKFLLRHQ